MRTVAVAIPVIVSTAPTSIALGTTDSTAAVVGRPVLASAIGGARVPALLAMCSTAACAPSLRGVQLTTTLVVAPGAATGTEASHARASGLHGAATVKSAARSVVSMNSLSSAAAPALRTAIACDTVLPIATAPKSTAGGSGARSAAPAYAHTASNASSTAPPAARARTSQRCMLAGAAVQVIASVCEPPAATVKPAVGACTKSASHPGSAVTLPTTIAAAVSLRSSIAPEPAPFTGASMTWTSGSA